VRAFCRRTLSEKFDVIPFRCLAAPPHTHLLALLDWCTHACTHAFMHMLFRTSGKHVGVVTCCSCGKHSPTVYLTHWNQYSLIDWLIDGLIGWLGDLFIHGLVDWWGASLTDWLICWLALICWLIDGVIYWPIDLLVDWWGDSFMGLLTWCARIATQGGEGD